MTNRHAFSLILGLIAVCPVSAALGAAGDTEMATTPIIHRAFCQDDFKTQLDRQPKDAAGNVLPSIEVKDQKRAYRVPAKHTQ